ncbi:Rpn family recombination-promoting nuclease/putative transposase [Escherichia coli]|uniref:Rpn family recombination-promoting nuclease/putative transposase n=1 Tax=Escherichia coli TaxID=562 RepID=UPI00398057B9
MVLHQWTLTMISPLWGSGMAWNDELFMPCNINHGALRPTFLSGGSVSEKVNKITMIHDGAFKKTLEDPAAVRDFLEQVLTHDQISRCNLDTIVSDSSEPY